MDDAEAAHMPGPTNIIKSSLSGVEGRTGRVTR